MPRASTPWWQQATALVSLSAGGAITGFSFVPKATVDLTSPASMPVNLLALQQSATAGAGQRRHAALRDRQRRPVLPARLAQDKTPAEMEAMIWQHDSIDGPTTASPVPPSPA